MVGLFSLMGALLLGWCIYIAWVAYERMHRGTEAAARTGIVASVTLGLVVVEVAMLFGLALPMWRSRMTGPPSSSNALAVRVVAERYLWHFHYPGPDGQFGDARPELITKDNPVGLDRRSAHGADDIVTTSLHVPIGQQVVAQLTSKDAIHSFGVNEFRVKQDVIPGIVATVWFSAAATGRFDIVCSGLCGPGHDQMRGVVVAESAEAFAEFLARAAKGLQ